YTAQFGNGVSGTISLEDPIPYRAQGIINTNATFIGPFSSNTNTAGVPLSKFFRTPNNFQGNAQLCDHVPDIVGNLRVDQAWGSAHIGAAAHELHGTYYTAADRNTGHPDAAWGYAVSGAFELKNLPTGAGDSFKAEATFGHGATKYVFGGTFD